MRLIFSILFAVLVAAKLEDLVDPEYEQMQAKLDLQLQQIKNVRNYV